MDFYDSPRITSQYVFCPFPFSMDSYDGCTHNCNYCFSYFNYLINQATKGKNFATSNKPVDIRHIERIFSNKPRTAKERELCEFVKRKIPVHWGGITDPFSDIEKKHGVSLQILRIMAKYKYPFIVSTKNKRLVTGEYYELLKKCDATVQVSLISTDKRLETIETNPEITIKNRLELIEKAAKAGKKVVVRVQPFIPKFCDDGIEKLLKEVAKRGAKAVTAEFLKFSIYSLSNPTLHLVIERMGKKLGFDMVKYYEQNGRGTNGDREIMPKFKRPSLERMKTLAHKYGLEFYCADNECRDLGDGYICCGLTEKEAPRKSELQINKMLFLAKKKGFVTFDDWTSDPDSVEMFKKIGLDWLNYGNYERRNKTMQMSMFNRAKKIWNSGGKGQQSMSKFFEKMQYMGKDKKGNSVYKYNYGNK